MFERTPDGKIKAKIKPMIDYIRQQSENKIFSQGDYNLLEIFFDGPLRRAYKKIKKMDLEMHPIDLFVYSVIFKIFFKEIEKLGVEVK